MGEKEYNTATKLEVENADELINEWTVLSFVLLKLNIVQDVHLGKENVLFTSKTINLPYNVC